MGERRTALITGASSGFGAEFARLFARDGFDLVLVARSGAAMEELAQVLDGRFGSTTTVLPKDLSHPHAVGELVDNLHQRGMAIDALVNNAGFAQYGPFAEAEPEELVQMLHVNVVALTELTRALLPGMVERGWGRIVNIGSVGSFAPAPMTGAYAATKAFVLSFSLALADELKGSGVTVTALCPGPTETGFQARAAMADSALIAGRRLDPADEVVRAGYEAMKRGRPYLVTGSTSKLFAFGSRFLPRTTASKIAGRSQRRIAEEGR
jgi:short-subunit dehydrogenase